jgi:plastocyanin
VRYRRPLFLFAAAAVIALGVAGTAGAHGRGGSDDTVRTQGRNGVRVNEIVFSTLHFEPGRVRIESGDEITFKHRDRTEEPHTATIVDRSDLPDTFDEVFGCQEPPGPCAAAFEAHGDPPAPAVEAPGSQPGLDAPGDSLWLDPGGEISAVVSAPPGSTLFYLCAVHPWMQGSIAAQ